MRKSNLRHELKALNGREITLGHKWETTIQGLKLKALNGKKITLGHKWEKKNDYGSWGQGSK